ncbi:hypothetical protein [Stieleria sp.]|uniref:hypothetical protein n=1 Tax=Stieleria sp. TaxID=2795976 RepID=UPI003569D173
MKCLSKCCLLAIAVISLTGCEPVTTEQHFSVPAGETLVAAPAVANQYRWPVIEDEWQATKPTDCGFLRQIKPGAIGEIADQILKTNQKRIEDAKSSQQPAPWMVASSGLTGKALTWARLALGEEDGQPVLRESVAMPPEVSNPTVWLDKTGRHLVVGGDNGLWISRLPWRPWWALPGTPPTELDEPGDASKFQHLALPTSGDGAIHVGFFGQQADGSDSRMIVAAGKQLHLVDCTTASVAATKTLNESIQHLSVAAETGHAAVVDQSGNLYLTDPELATAAKIGEVDVSLPMPAISPEATRIAAWHDEQTGRVFKLVGGALDYDFEVPLADPGEPLMVRCSRGYDLWIEKNACHRRPNDPNTPGNDLQTWPVSIYWDIVDVIDLHQSHSHRTQLCFADRPLPDGGTERVMYDAILGARSFGRPTPTKRFGDRTPVVAACGNVIAFHDGQTIDLYARIVNAPQGLYYLGELVRNWARQNQFDHLEALHAVIRALPERRFNRTKEQIYKVLVEEIAMAWFFAEQALENDHATEADLDATKKRLAGFAEWGDLQSPLALTAKMRYCTTKAWNARGNGWSSSVSENGWQTFESQNKMAMEAWHKLQPIDDVPAVAYQYFVDAARDLSFSYDDTYDEIRDYLERFPHDDMLHLQVMIWRLERWGGTRGSGSAYAAAVAQAIGPPMGDFIYSRCIQKIENVYVRAFFGYAQVDGNRVLAGVRQGLDMEYFQEQSTPEAIILVAGSHSRLDTPGPNSAYAKTALRLCEDLAEYYRWRYPMLTTDVATLTGKEKIDRMKAYLPE